MRGYELRATGCELSAFSYQLSVVSKTTSADERLSSGLVENSRVREQRLTRHAFCGTFGTPEGMP